MIKLRWKVEEWEEWPEFSRISEKKKSEPVLQYSRVIDVDKKAQPIWSDWEDVPTEYIDGFTGEPND